MDILLAILSFLFFAALIGVALTFGMALLVVFVSLILGVIAFASLRNAWRRWRFTHEAGATIKKTDAKIIEAEFIEIQTSQVEAKEKK